MATLKELKGRIGSIKNTQKITKAMKMVAAAKLRRAQDRIIHARPYARKMNELLSQLISNSGELKSEFAEDRGGNNRLVVIVAADRGLSGSFNTNIIRYGQTYIDTLPEGRNTKVLLVGKKSVDYFKKRGYNAIDTKAGIFGNLQIEDSEKIVERIVSGFLKGEYDAVDIIYNSFVSVARQQVVKEQFLPLQKNVEEKADNKSKNLDYIYEPSAEEIIKDLIPRQLNMQLWKSLLESNAAEQAARMTAMETATKNATDLIASLELQYNRARQEAITKEILEIVGGAEALKDA